MTPSQAGLAWCFVFILLEAVQSVFFGGLFQRMDSFLVGSLVFGSATLGCLVWVVLRTPGELKLALGDLRSLIGLNVTVALAWTAYLLAIQTIEPAVAFTIFSGAVPLTTILAHRLGVPEAGGLKTRAEVLGNGILLGGLLILAAVTVSGWSGFVRGGAGAGLLGVGLAAASGFIITWMIFFGRRLYEAGVGATAQFGLRSLLYILMAAAGAFFGLDHKGAVPAGEVFQAVLIGLVIMAFPVYAVQRAVTLVAPLTIGAASALAPLLIFTLQLLEGRVDYAPATLIGLMIYFTGALIAAWGTASSKLTAESSSC